MLTSTVLLAAISVAVASPLQLQERALYTKVDCPANRAIISPSYMTYKLVEKDTPRKDCKTLCNEEPGCISYNSFLDNNAFNKEGSTDGVANFFTCSLFGDKITADEATNAAGQTGEGGKKTRITRSSCFTLTTTPDCVNPSTAKTLFSGYSGNDGDSKFSFNLDDVNTNGYTHTPQFDVKAFTYRVPNTVELFKLYNSQSKDSFYTDTTTERDSAVTTYHYDAQGTIGWVYATQLCTSVPWYRFYSPANSDHAYTVVNSPPDSSYTQVDGISAYVLPL